MAAKQTESEPFVVVILGCTGTGKSKLAIEIGKAIGGEVISADSMQVYKGLDIITNKVTPEEQIMIPHHMIDVVEAKEKFSVVEFKNTALPLIRGILERQKVPIVVGGTNYYIESLLWENLIETSGQSDPCSMGDSGLEVGTMIAQHDNPEHERSKHAKEEHGKLEHEHSKLECSEHEHSKLECSEHEHSKHATEEHGNLEHEPSEGENSEHEHSEHERSEHRHPENENALSSSQASIPGSIGQQNSQDALYQTLVEVDPAMARKLHPNDTRKIARSLQVYEHTGRTHSELIAQQQAQEGATSYGGPMRFKNVCVLWLQCDLKTLDKRLDARVDKMLEQGLVEELLEFHNSRNTHFSDPKTQNAEGIFQSIGFKEFQEFLNSGNPIAEKNDELFSECVHSMKCATRRYARKQIKWVVNRFLGRPSTCAPDVYGLDAADLEQWEARVLGKGLSIVKGLMAGEKVLGQLLSRVDSNAASKHSRHICEVCNKRTIIGDKSWTMHLRSRSHRHYKKRSKQT